MDGFFYKWFNLMDLIWTNIIIFQWTLDQPKIEKTQAMQTEPVRDLPYAVLS